MNPEDEQCEDFFEDVLPEVVTTHRRWFRRNMLAEMRRLAGKSGNERDVRPVYHRRLQRGRRGSKYDRNE